MSWLTIQFLATWLPLVRGAMDGPSYEWGSGLLGWQFSGSGLSDDYAFILAKAFVAVALLLYGWRQPNRGFRPALLAWLMLMLVDTLYNVVTSPESFRFQG